MSLRTVKCLRDESDAFKQSIFGWNCIEAVDQPPKGERYIKYDNHFNDWIVYYRHTHAAIPRFMSRHQSMISAVFHARK